MHPGDVATVREFAQAIQAVIAAGTAARDAGNAVAYHALCGLRDDLIAQVRMLVPPQDSQEPQGQAAKLMDQRHWLRPIIPAEPLAISISLNIDVPGLVNSGIQVWRDIDGWYSRAEWKPADDWLSTGPHGPFATVAAAEIAARQDLDRLAREQDERQ